MVSRAANAAQRLTAEAGSLDSISAHISAHQQEFCPALQEEEPPMDTSKMAATQAWTAPLELALNLQDDQPEPGNGAESRERGILVSLAAPGHAAAGFMPGSGTWGAAEMSSVCAPCGDRAGWAA